MSIFVCMAESSGDNLKTQIDEKDIFNVFSTSGSRMQLQG